MAYFSANGGVGTTLPDLERSFLINQLGLSAPVAATTNDLWLQFLADFTGNLPDRLLQFWLAGGSVAYDVAGELFGAGEQGVWYDPSDLSTVFRDPAGTVPVTGVGQPVGCILDKSGRGNHATQSSTTSRPTLQQDGSGRYYLAFDGTNDSLAAASINFGASDKMTIVAGIQRDTTTVGILLELSASLNSFPSAFYLTSPGGGIRSAEFRAGGTIVPPGTDSAYLTYTGVPTPDKHVLTAIGDIAGDLTRLRRNGVAGTDGVLDQGTGNFGNYPLYIGRRGGSSMPFSGRMYQLIVRGALTADLAPIEAFTADKTGVTLP